VIVKAGEVLAEPGSGQYIAGRAQNYSKPSPGLHQGLSLEPR